jgi:hypothetical protein
MRTEKILSAVFLLGLVLKFLNIPAAGMLLMLSLMGIGILYFPAAYYFFSDKEIKRQNIPLTIVAGLFLSLIPIGILFKLLYWPGPVKMYLIIGAVTAPIIFIISYISRTKAVDDLKIYYKNMLFRTGILTVLAVLFLLTSPGSILKIQYRNDPELARLKIQYFENRDNKEYKKQYDAYMLKHYPSDTYTKYLQADTLNVKDSL